MDRLLGALVGMAAKIVKTACTEPAFTFDIVCYFDNTGNMETMNAAERLAALGHETRLAVFRLLVQAGPAGLSAGVIGEQMGLAPATLSFHLAHLNRVGLISARQDGRFIYYATDFSAMDALIAFLTDNCCNGASCLPKTAVADTLAKRRRASSKSTR